MPITGASEKLPGLFFDNGGAWFHAGHPDYGASPTASATQNRVAIQAAIDAAAAAGGGTVLVPNGTCSVDASANTVPGASGLYALLLPSGVSLVASGTQSKIHCVTDGATIVAAAGASSASHVTDVEVAVPLVGGDTTNNLIGRGVYFFRADRCKVRDCTISGVRLGVQIDRASSDSAYNKGCALSNVIVRDTVGTTGGNGTGFFIAGVDGLVATNIQALNVAEHGMYLSESIRNVTVNGAVMQPGVNTNLNCGIQIYTSAATPDIKSLSFSGVVIQGGKWGFLASTTNGKIKKLSLSGGAISGALTAGVLLSNVQGATINGVPVEGTTAGSGIEVDNSRSVSLNGCCSTGNFGYGALFVNSPNCSVTGGDYLNNDTGLNGNAGIRFASASTGGKVTGGRCTDDQASKTQAYGILTDADCGGFQFLGVDVAGNRTGSIQLSGALGRVESCPGYNPGGPSTVTVTASPMTITNNDSTPETIFVKGGTVSSITKGGITLAVATNTQVLLQPGQSIVITYSSAPTLAKDVH
jgi:hypothetical protein